jgi:hypothetical protein
VERLDPKPLNVRANVSKPLEVKPLHLSEFHFTSENRINCMDTA